MVKCLVTYVTKCMADANLKTISIRNKVVNFKKNICKLWFKTSKTLYCNQYSADFTILMSLARVVFAPQVDISLEWSKSCSFL